MAMTTMTQPPNETRRVVGGVDAHKDVHVAAALEARPPARHGIVPDDRRWLSAAVALALFALRGPAYANHFAQARGRTEVQVQASDPAPSTT
jgi:hypothetical protein